VSNGSDSCDVGRVEVASVEAMREENEKVDERERARLMQNKVHQTLNQD